MEKELNTELLTDSGIPEHYWRLSRDTYYGDAKALRVVDKYVRQAPSLLKEGFGLLFQGDRDTLKTFLMAHLLMNLLAAGYTVTYLSVEDLTDLYWAKEKPFEATIKAPHFLAIDRVNEPENQGTITVLKRVVSTRKDIGRPVFLATSLPPEIFSTHYTGRIYDYISDYLSVVPTRVTGEARRERAESRNRLLGASVQPSSRWS